jgi:hypothetical protein
MRILHDTAFTLTPALPLGRGREKDNPVRIYGVSPQNITTTSFSPLQGGAGGRFS